MGTFDQTGIGDKVADGRETANIVDFIKNHECEDRTNTWNGTQELVLERIVIHRMVLDRLFDIEDDPVVMIEQTAIRIDTVLYERVRRKVIVELLSVGLVSDPFLEIRKVVLRIRVLDMC